MQLNIDMFDDENTEYYTINDLLLYKETFDLQNQYNLYINKLIYYFK